MNSDKSILFVGINTGVKDLFYKKIGETYGHGRQNLRRATEEALKDWIDKKIRENGH